MTIGRRMQNNQSLTTRRGVVAVAVRNGRLLVIRRSRHVAAPGAYCFPGGEIEEGEGEEQAVVREMEEELGATVEPLRRIWRNVTPWGVELAWWLVALPADAVLVANEHEVGAVHWLTPDEILALPQLLESNREFMAAWQRGEFTVTAAPMGNSGD